MMRFVLAETFHNPLVRKGAGMLAMGVATLLAFETGQDVARQLTGGSEVAKAAEAPRAAPIAPKVALQPAPAPVDSPFVVKSVLPIKDPIKFGQYFWDAGQGPADGTLVITVDLEARTISVFRDGHEIGAAAILKGYGDKPTPVGVFPITEKDADHVSNIFDAPMPYMLRLTNDGVSIHGSKVEKGYATNGCIGVPEKFAKLVFDQAKLGDSVIVSDGKRIGVGDPIISPTQ
jgi:lipoprotein-anchoring transpeptidase ErfK/SrfK